MIAPKQIHEVADEIAQNFNPIKIILFGSHGRGQAHAHSDVDLLVMIDEEHNGVDFEVAIPAGIAHPFPMDILVRTPQQIANRLRLGDDFFRDIVEKGVVLYERTGPEMARQSRAGLTFSMGA